MTVHHVDLTSDAEDEVASRPAHGAAALQAQSHRFQNVSYGRAGLLAPPDGKSPLKSTYAFDAPPGSSEYGAEVRQVSYPEAKSKHSVSQSVRSLPNHRYGASSIPDTRHREHSMQHGVQAGLGYLPLDHLPTPPAKRRKIDLWDDYEGSSSASDGNDKDSPKKAVIAAVQADAQRRPPYTEQEDNLLLKLRADGASWPEIARAFPARTLQALQVRWSTKFSVKAKLKAPASQPVFSRASPPQSAVEPGKPPKWVPYTQEEDDLLQRLRGEGTSWERIARHFNGRTAAALCTRWYTKFNKGPSAVIKKAPIRTKVPPIPAGTSPFEADSPPMKAVTPVIKADTPAMKASTPSVKADTPLRKSYTQEEDDRLVRLREQGVPWSRMHKHFPGRTNQALQTHFATTLSKRYARPVADKSSVPLKDDASLDDNVWLKDDVLPQDDAEAEELVSERPQLKSMKSLRRRTTGGASRAQLASAARKAELAAQSGDDASSHLTPRPAVDMTRLWRNREIGSSYRSNAATTAEMQNYVHDAIAACRYVNDASGDVATVAWSPNNAYFAAGSVVLTDIDSMQYNRPRNLLFGDTITDVVRELPHHHIVRPLADSGVNALESMRQTQDSRLFTTVQSVQFSPDSQYLYAVSIDGKLNAYSTSEPAKLPVATFEHGAPVDLLSINSTGLIATGARDQEDNVRVIKHDGTRLRLQQWCNPSSVGTGIVAYPSALKWGVTAGQKRYLLAGFAQSKNVDDDDDEDVPGDSCLFDVETGARIELGVTGNVFDVAWSPNLGQYAFAVAAAGAKARLNQGMHSVVRLYNEQASGVRTAVELECPARDINDVLFSPYDNNIVAAGSTDGRIYIWDTRYTKQSQDPQRVLTHGSCLSVLPHDRKRWEADTGIRFLAFGANHSRLFSGSSDGKLKIWDPNVAEQDAFVRDAATFSSAIMSGAFNSDYTSLLIGEDAGRLTQLSTFNASGSDCSPSRFAFVPAPAPPSLPTEPLHRTLLASRQVVFAPLGHLPVRQAVQGPTYNMLRTRLTLDDAALYTASQRFQRELWHKRNRWKRAKRDLPGPRVEPCGIGCGSFLTRNGEDGDAAEDSLRSTGRVPDVLRYPPRDRAEALSRGLVAVCGGCGAPALAPEREDKEVRCERCSFACFRCGETAELRGAAVRKVVCAGCGLEWAAGALGYYIEPAGSTRQGISDGGHQRLGEEG